MSNFCLQKTYNQENTIESMLSVILLSLPRTGVTYALYPIAILLSLKLKLKSTLKLISILFILTLFFTINSLFSELHFMNYALETYLCLPFFIFISGFELKKNFNRIKTIRLFNLILFLLSIINLFHKGFPERIPYINMLPDVFGALFGLGGAKIVTIVGFFGLISELHQKKFSIYIFLALFNLIAPSYLTGLCLAIGSLVIAGILTRPKTIPFLILIAFLIAPHFSNRLKNLNDAYLSIFKVHPKILSYKTSLKILNREASTSLFGTGFGQFSGESSQWSSDIIPGQTKAAKENRKTKSRTRKLAKVFHLKPSYYHKKYLTPILKHTENNAFLFQSSINKPFTGISTLVVEMGIPLFLIISFLWIKRIFQSSTNLYTKITIFIFTLCLFFLENIHCNIWYFSCLSIVLGKNHTPCTKDISHEI